MSTEQTYLIVASKPVIYVPFTKEGSQDRKRATFVTPHDKAACRGWIEDPNGFVYETLSKKIRDDHREGIGQYDWSES